jgi:NADPH-dependent curcumin reductase CurA
LRHRKASVVEEVFVSDRVNRQWLLKSRPSDMVEASNFELSESSAPEPAEGEFLVRNLYLSLDPAMRVWMTDAPSYIPPVEIGEVMRGACVGRVVESHHPDYAPGEAVLGVFGWQDFDTSDGGGAIPVTKVPEGVPLTMPLGVLGITSLTAYFGLKEIAKPSEGETVVVSGAAGATGSVAGQLAKLWGCTVVGIAGGSEKCDWLKDELGFDAAIDYKGENVSRRLRELCPGGLDVFWDNVGGETLEAALANLAMGARVVLCGAISNYNSPAPSGPRNYMNLLVRRARMEGFVVFDYMNRTDEAMRELVPLVTEGKIRFREDVRDGLEAAPTALVDLYTGDNRGKLLVKIADPEGV